MQPISSNASQQGALSEMARQSVSGLAPAGIQAMVEKQVRNLWRLIYFSNNICILDCVCVLCGDFYSIPSLFILLNETALAKPLALFDLQVGDPNPYQLTPADLQRDEVRSSISLRVASERIEPIASLALWKTTREGLLPILECVGTQVWSLHFLGNFAILTPFA